MNTIVIQGNQIILLSTHNVANIHKISILFFHQCFLFLCPWIETICFKEKSTSWRSSGSMSLIYFLYSYKLILPILSFFARFNSFEKSSCSSSCTSLFCFLRTYLVFFSLSLFSLIYYSFSAFSSLSAPKNNNRFCLNQSMLWCKCYITYLCSGFFFESKLWPLILISERDWIRIYIALDKVLEMLSKNFFDTRNT